MSSQSLQISPSVTPFPYTIAVLASHQSIPLDWQILGAPTVKFDGKEGVEQVEEALKRLLLEKGKGKENALPSLPSPLNADTPFPQIGPILNILDDHIALRTYFSGRRLGYADVFLYGTLKSANKALGLLKQGKHQHLSRWFEHIDSLPQSKEVSKGLFDAKNAEAAAAKKAKDQKGTVDAELKNAVVGKVVVRFAPEPSGYLHIGHIKACILNRYLADKYKGTFILRFDDTNPEKEEDAFESSFESDLEMLGVKWDKVVHTSDHFGKIEEFARRLIQEGNAYMDDTDQMTMREQRAAFLPSKNRDNSIEINLHRFEEMLSGSEEGQKWFMRAKIDYKSPNGAMRDPAVYRCVNKAHHVTGDQYKAYPMYDLACPIVDHLDGVTHALRANEYAARKPQYEWFLQALGLPHIEIFDFSRLDFVYTLLSKRKLKTLVEKGYVSGWEDPRFPTIRGMRARGMTLEALRGFIASQGASSQQLLMEWDQIWAWNKKVIDPVVPRYWAIAEDDVVKVRVTNGPEKPETRTLPAHKKNPEVGDKKTVYASDLIVEQADAASFGENEEVTFMDWGNAFIRKKNKNSAGKIDSLEIELFLEGDFKKTDKKVTWLTAPSATELIPVVLIEYDYLITKKKIEDTDDFTACLNPKTEYRTNALADVNVKNLKQWDIIQFERKGYHIYQGTKDAEGRMEFGFIPDGRMPTVVLKGIPFAEDSTAAIGAPGEKGWGKNANPTASKAPKPLAQASAPEGVKIHLSEGSRGFEIPTTVKMHQVDRVYGLEEVVAPSTVNMYKAKPVYDS